MHLRFDVCIVHTFFLVFLIFTFFPNVSNLFPPFARPLRLYLQLLIFSLRYQCHSYYDTFYGLRMNNISYLGVLHFTKFTTRAGYCKLIFYLWDSLVKFVTLWKMRNKIYCLLFTWLLVSSISLLRVQNATLPIFVYRFYRTWYSCRIFTKPVRTAKIVSVFWNILCLYVVSIFEI